MLSQRQLVCSVYDDAHKISIMLPIFHFIAELLDCNFSQGWAKTGIICSEELLCCIWVFRTYIQNTLCEMLDMLINITLVVLVYVKISYYIHCMCIWLLYANYTQIKLLAFFFSGFYSPPPNPLCAFSFLFLIFTMSIRFT